MTSSETPESSENPDQSFLDAVGDAEDAALAAVRRAVSSPGGLAGAHRRERLVTSLRIMDRDFAEWLIFDGRAKRTESGSVYLDTTALCQRGRGLPDVVDGGALALDVYLTAFAAALTDGRCCTRLIRNGNRTAAQVGHGPTTSATSFAAQREPTTSR